MDEVEQEDMVFRALTDPTRRTILLLLGSAGQLSVSEISDHFPTIGRTAISAHLRVLREAGLVIEEKEGRRRLYQLGPNRASFAIEFLRQVYESSFVDEASGSRRGRPTREKQRDAQRFARRSVG
ncbi:DNA-binding transcriptional ArsR family regulator [Microbacterium foliorum]|uniref:DNA-binding transcriptional ArsR family regulator n=1 Tax=Microbacterium foliorum TaxID=104336 RepID=A0ABU1HW47_9MICO|nr:metalloregulator ArsR/SmtB family transcription factor [Microbacterium foliorum]MDR6144071.1 DNA-binding transcriptional ArsR family regulator [Microbacterium foliorum]